MTECLECKDNDNMFSNSMMYKCSSDFCVHYIKPVVDEPITPLKVLITPSYNRRAIDKYTASHQEQIKANYRKRRLDPAFVERNRLYSLMYSQKRRQAKLLLKETI